MRRPLRLEPVLHVLRVCFRGQPALKSGAERVSCPGRWAPAAGAVGAGAVAAGAVAAGVRFLQHGRLRPQRRIRPRARPGMDHPTLDVDAPGGLCSRGPREQQIRFLAPHLVVAGRLHRRARSVSSAHAHRCPPGAAGRAQSARACAQVPRSLAAPRPPALSALSRRERRERRERRRAHREDADDADDADKAGGVAQRPSERVAWAVGACLPRPAEGAVAARVPASRHHLAGRRHDARLPSSQPRRWPPSCALAEIGAPVRGVMDRDTLRTPVRNGATPLLQIETPCSPVFSFSFLNDGCPVSDRCDCSRSAGPPSGCAGAAWIDIRAHTRWEVLHAVGRCGF